MVLNFKDLTDFLSSEGRQRPIERCINYQPVFIKRFALCYQTIVCSVLSVCLWCWCTVAKQLDGSR